MKHLAAVLGMTSVHKLRKLGENTHGEKAGIEFPKDDLLMEDLLDENGRLVEQPSLAISRVGPGEWKIKRLEQGFDEASD